MPETEYECVSKEWLQSELRSTSADAKELIILDCRSSHEYGESHIRSAVNFSIPSIMLRRLAAGKIDLLSTIKSPELKERIQSGYKISLFILYNDVGVLQSTTTTGESPTGSGGVGGGGGGGGGCIGNGLDVLNLNGGVGAGDATINVLHRRLKQDGCRVVSLQDGFASFHQAFPEWCEDDGVQNKEMDSSRSTQADQLMGLRSLRISTPHSDSACSSSAESSDCESTTHHNFNEAPVEIIPGLFLGNATHSRDSRALQKYNIKYVLNVTPDLPNVFEASDGIQYLQIPITDHYSQDLAMHFPAAIQFIEEARSKNSAVLVHCLAGVSRSVTVTLAYLMHTRALCLNDAFTLVRNRKPDVSPNFHFMQQLHSFERQLQLSPNAMDESDGGGGDGGGLGIGIDINIGIGIGIAGMGVDAGVGSLGGGSNTHHSSGNMSGIGGGGGGGSGGSGNLGGGGSGGSGGGTGGGCGGGGGGGGGLVASGARCGSHHGSKFTCNCIATDCKCMQTGGYMAQLAKATGVSPDSGIEFDRWTPSADTGLK